MRVIFVGVKVSIAQTRSQLTEIKQNTYRYKYIQTYILAFSDCFIIF